MAAESVTLVDVRKLAPVAREVIACFRRDFAAVLTNVEVHHIGATSLPFGHTKGDVDVNVRVPEPRFDSLIAALSDRLERAQTENWTATFASFSARGFALPLGVQVTVIGSPDDFLLALRDRMRADTTLLRRYDEAKVAAAADGPAAYWRAKDELLRELVSE